MKNLIYIIPFVLILGSCSERIDFSLEHTPKIDISSEFTAGNELIIRASTSGGLGTGQSIQYPDLTIELSTEDGEVRSIRPTNKFGKGFYINDQLQLVEGESYQIRAFSQDDDLTEVTATSRIPSSATINTNGFKFINVPQSIESSLQDGKSIRKVEVEFDFELSVDPQCYYHLEVYRFGADENIYPLRVVNLDEEQEEAFRLLEHKPGVLLNESKLTTTRLKLELQSINLIDSSKEDLDKLYVVLKTTTKDYYEFHYKLSDQIRASILPNNTPVINFTNIDNGYGLFAGYSMVDENFEL